MSGRTTVRALAGLIAAATSAGVISITAPPAAAATALPGSILYVRNSNVFATNGPTTRQITTNGGTAAADRTGSSGYLVPSQSADGRVVVAVRNQRLTSPTDQQTYYRGYLWVMDPYGHVLRKISPPQYAYNSGKQCGLPANAPQGILNAQVSPDGRHIAYTMQELFETTDCRAASAYRTTVVNIDGSNPVAIDDGSGQITAAESLEMGSWVDNSSLLVDRADFGSVQVYRVTLPRPSAAAWFAPDSWLDAAYEQPVVRGSVLVTDGYSESAMHNVVRLWSTSGSTTTPTYRCEVGSAVDPSDSLSDVSLAPDGSAVAYQDTSSDNSVTRAGQGLYTMSTAGGSCGTPQLLVAGANDAFWSPAGVAPPPSVVLGSHPAGLTNTTSATIAFTVYHSGAAPAVTCRLDSGAARACGSPARFSGLRDGSHTVTITAADGVHPASTATYTWRVDTSRPGVTITAPTAAAITGSAVANNWTGRDTGSGVASYQQQIRRASVGGRLGGWANLGKPWPASVTRTTVSGLARGYTYCLRVKATDRAGNVGYSAPRCFAVALDDRALTASAGWHKSTGSSYYARTAMTTTKRGASLRRTNATLDRVGVIAKTGPRAGKIGVYVGSRLIGKLSLAAAHTHYRTVLLLPRFSLRSGTVTVKVLSSGRSVVVDGLVISKS